MPLPADLIHRHLLTLISTGLIACANAAEPATHKPQGAAPLLLAEDFEQTPPGQIPKGFTRTGAVAVAEDAAHSGRHALRLEAADNGPRRITVQDQALMTALGGEHWGRLYFKVQLPTPTPQGEGGFPVIHSTLVAGSAQSPQFMDPIEVRMLDTVMGPKGTFQYIYNVQPRKRPEFANGSTYDHRYTDEWTLAEWHLDFATQSYQLFINGTEIAGASMTRGPGMFEKAEIPAVFANLSFGWNNYQKAEPTGIIAWIDDLALSKERIGERGVPPIKAPKKPGK